VRTTKSPLRVLKEALQVGQQTLRAYSHRFSPKKFTQPQLFACLVLKEFLRLDYRKLQAVLADSPSMAAAIELSAIPHYTTFQKAAVRLLTSHRAERLLDVTVQRARMKGKMKRRVKLASIDGTGFETHHISAYYVKRRQKGQKHEFQTTTYTRYPYAVITCDCASHIILAVVPSRGPGSDLPYFKPSVRQTARRVTVDTLLADAGFDSEASHAYARHEHRMRTVIPPTRGRPTAKLPSGRWRRLMATRFNKKKYGQRWQVETVNSMLKRLLDSALRARRYWSQWREIFLRVLTHNVMVLWIWFSTEQFSVVFFVSQLRPLN